MLKVLILVGGLLFIAYTLFFGGGNKSKFKSDLPSDKKSIFKTKKGILIICLLTLLLTFSVYLMVSFLTLL